MPSSGASRCSAGNKPCVICRTNTRPNRGGAFNPFAIGKEAGDIGEQPTWWHAESPGRISFLPHESGCPLQPLRRIGTVIDLFGRLDVVEKVSINDRLPCGGDRGKQDRCAGRI